MKIVVLFSSPNRDGNTGLLLDSFLKGCKGNIEIINVYRLDVRPCTDCKGCYKTGRCVVDDDMGAVYEAVDSCDAVIIASPVYFTSFPAPLKLVIDRFQAYWSKKFIIKDTTFQKRKRGVLLMTSGVKGQLAFSNCEAVMKQFFSLINAEFFLKVYAEATDANPVEQDMDIKKSAMEKGTELCRAV